MPATSASRKSSPSWNAWRRSRWCAATTTHQDWAADIPERLLLKIGRLTLYVLHDLKRLDLDPAAEGIDVVVAGHSHKPLKEERDGVLYLNPGSAGPRRFSLPIGIGVLEVAGKKIEAELITL